MDAAIEDSFNILWEDIIIFNVLVIVFDLISCISC